MTRCSSNILAMATLFTEVVAMFVVAVWAVSCNKLGDTVTTSRDRIRAELKADNIYERNNLPKDELPSRIFGYFDILNGAYRYIVNEYASGGVDSERDGRSILPVINEGDSISFYFDARVYKGKWDSSTTFYTNIESRREVAVGSNAQAVLDLWPVVPMKIKVGNDPQILNSLQKALISGEVRCRAAGTRTVAVEETNAEGETVVVEKVQNLASDIVRVYLTPDIAFGDKWVYDVPRGSTIVFELIDINIIEN